MTTFKLEIKCDNAAFADYPGEEIAQILKDLADKVEDYADFDFEFTLRDSNGNKVGKAWVES